MDRFDLTDLSKRFSEIVEIAVQRPVRITDTGKGDFVLLTADRYDQLVAAGDSRRAFHADTMPEDLANVMLAALERQGD